MAGRNTATRSMLEVPVPKMAAMWQWSDYRRADARNDEVQGAI